MSDLQEFRTEARAWLAENCPESMRQPIAEEADACWGGRNFTFKSDDQKNWLVSMAAKGWTAPSWPKEYGGGGLMREEAKILGEEMKRINARVPLMSFGIWMLGPALLKYGSEEQKKHYLPDIVNGKIRWCQGYSEPNSGSDLASLATKAEDKGDHYLVNGQKIWTSYADQADWIFCLVRTDPTVPKHYGVSFLLFDMASEGVSTKPIQLISGSSPFCETFMDDVKVPKENLIGELGKGWDIAKYLLTHEREAIGGDMGAHVSLGDMARKHIGMANGCLADTVLRPDIASLDIQGLAFMATVERVKDEAQAGQGLGAGSSMLKYAGSEFNKDRYEMMVKIGGAQALEWESDGSEGGKLARGWLRTKANSIEGGTSEVQLNVISKRILGLPS